MKPPREFSRSVLCRLKYHHGSFKFHDVGDFLFPNTVFHSLCFSCPCSCSAQEGDAAQTSALVTLPDATNPDAFIKWANSLPASNPPTWLGLAPNAEAALLATRGEQLLSTWQVNGLWL